jgi:hypothetical protein
MSPKQRGSRVYWLGTFNRKSRTASRYLERSTRLCAKRFDFQTIFDDSATNAPQVIVGNAEEDIVTASKFQW